MNEHQYYVIQFLEAPYKEIADYVCVPSSWVQTRGPIDPKVKVAYPDEDLLVTETKVKKWNQKSDQWKSYLSVIKHGTDSFVDAKRYIQELLDNEDDKPRRSSRRPMPSAKMMPTRKSANTTAQKREALPDSDEEAHIKRSKLKEPNENNKEVASLSNQTFEFMSDNQSLPYGMSVDYLSTQQVHENPAETKYSLNFETITKQECLKEFCRVELQELQTHLQVYTTTLFAKAIKKIMSIVNACSACQSNNQIVSISKNLPQKGPTYNELKRNETQTQANDSDDDIDDQPLTKIFHKLNNKIVLPPENDDNDSRWTLKYREPAPGLIELMEHSGVYVNADKFADCKKLSNNCQTFAQMLLSEIFTANALSICKLGKNFGIGTKHHEPELDSHATVTLLKFVAEYGLEQDWEVDDYDRILNGIRKKLRRTKNEKERERRTQEPGNPRRGDYGNSIFFSKHSRKRRFVLPPEYNKDDSKWTLKYHESAPGLVELMKHSGVYVNALRLANCKRLSRDCKTLARMLLTEIFTTSALSTCSWTGARARAFDQNGRNVRPGLDEHARTVLLNYVADRAKKEGWTYVENQSILNTMRNKMQEMRFKHKS